LLFFTVVTGVMLHPVVLNFSKLPAGGDVYEYIWKLWWFKHTLIETGQSPWVAPHIYYPFGYLLSYGETTPANTVLGLPLTLFLGEIRAYNSLLLLSTILSGFTMFLLVRETTGSFGAGLLAGTIYAFAPYRRVRFVHLNLLSTQWLPLTFYFLQRFMNPLKKVAPRPVLGPNPRTRGRVRELFSGESFIRTERLKWAVGGGIAFGLNALASWYYAVAGGVSVLVWALACSFSRPEMLRRKRTWQGAGVLVAVAGLLIVPFALPYLPVVSDPDTLIPMENTNFYSASPGYYLLPSPFHPLWGNLVRKHLLPRRDWGEFILGWGFVAWLFALYALRWADRKTTRPWLWITLVSLILSLGLTLHLAGRQVVLPAPHDVVLGVNRILDTVSLNSLKHEPFSLGRGDGLVIPMPALLLRWFVPLIGSVRTWSRFGQMALFGVAVLAGMGVAAWQRREVGPRRRGAWAVVLGLALFELWWAPVTMHEPITPRPVDRWLAAQEGDRPIIEYPLDSAFRPQQFIYTWTHGRPIVHGYATYFTFLFSRRHPELLDFPSPASLARLAEWGVQYVLIETAPPYRPQAQAILTKVAQEPCLRKVTTQGSIEVYELRAWPERRNGDSGAPGEWPSACAAPEQTESAPHPHSGATGEKNLPSCPTTPDRETTSVER